MSAPNQSANDDVPLSTEVPGTAQRAGTNTKGFAFEAKICAVFGLKGSTQNHFTNFSIQQNVQSALIGKFDDIVLVASDASNSRTEYFFQLKQSDTQNKRQTPLTVKEFNNPNRNNKLYLPDYLDIIKKSQSKNYQYIIFTDRPIDDAHPDFQLCDQAMYPAMFNLGGKVHKLKCFPNADPKTLDKLFIFSDQTPEVDVNSLIESILQNELLVDKNDAEDLRRKYVEFIEGWMDGHYGGFRPLSKNDIILKVIHLAFASNLQKFDLQLSFMEKTSVYWKSVSRERKCILIENLRLPQHEQQLSLTAEGTRQTLQKYTSSVNWEKPVSDSGLHDLEKYVINKQLSKYTRIKSVEEITLEILHGLLNRNKNYSLLLDIFDWVINERRIIHTQMWKTEFSDEELDEVKKILQNTDVKVGKKWNMEKLYDALKNKGYCEVLIQILMGGVKGKRFVSDLELKSKLNEKEQNSVQNMYSKHVLQRFFGREYELNSITLFWFLWREGEVPLILNIKDSRADFLAKVLPKTSKSYVLTSNGPLVSTWKKLKEAGIETLYHFQQLTEENRKKLFNLSIKLQGRECEFGQVIPNDLLSKIKMSDILTLLLGKFCIGAANYSLPSIFIRRKLHKLVVSDQVFKQSVKFVFLCVNESIFKGYIKVNEPKINFTKDVQVLSKRSMPSSSNSDPVLNYESFDEGTIFVVLDYSVGEVKSAIKKRSAQNETFYLYSLNQNKIISVDYNLVKKINVVIVPDSRKYNLSVNTYDTYKSFEIDLSKIPTTCLNIITSESVSMHFTKFHTNINFLFFVASKSVFEFLGSTKDSFNTIKQHIKTSSENDFRVENLLHFNNLLLLTGEPGMGKTVLANYFASVTDCEYVTVFIDAQSTYNFKTFGSETECDMFNYLQPFFKYPFNPEVEKLVFSAYTNNKKTVIIVDGFDEILSEFEKPFCNFLEKALSIGLKVIINARLVKVEFLQDRFSVFARRIASFSEDDQLHYLYQFLNEKFVVESETLERFVKDTITNKKRNSAWDSEFAGIALQTHMLSEVYAEQFRKYSNDEKKFDFGNKPFDILDLYRKFIEIKISVLKSKVNIGEGTKAEFYLNKAIKDCLLKEHEHCALKAIFNTVPSNVNITKFCTEYDTSIGLISAFSFNEIPVFVHRTYAEYLSATYISENFYTLFVRELYESMLENPIYDTVRQLTDRILADGNQLHLAILNNDNETVNKLLSDEHCDKPDKAGRLPLHIAMAWGFRQQLVRVTDMDMFFSFGFYLKPHVDIIENNIVYKLLPRTTDLLCVDNIFGYTPLYYGFQTMRLHNCNYYLLAVLVQYKNYEVIKKEFCKVCKLENSEFVKRLLYMCCVHNYSFIFRAIIDLKQKKKKIFEILFQANLQLNLLHLSSFFGSNDVVNIIISENQIDVNSTDTANRNPLFYAVMGRNQSTCKLLIQNEANPHLANVIGETSYSVASIYKWQNIIEIIENNTHEKYKNEPKVVNKLSAAIISGNAAELNQLLSSGENPNLILQNSVHTPLTLASGIGNLQVVQLLLAAGVQVNFMNAQNQTALMVACLNAKAQIVQYLLQNNADAHLTDQNGCTAMHLLADYKGSDEICLKTAETLLRHGASVNTQNNTFGTPLMYAAFLGNAPLAEFFLSKGANIHAKWIGATALDIALYYKQPQIANILMLFLALKLTELLPKK